MPPKPESFRILGVRIDKVGWKEIDQFCLEALRNNQPQQIVTLNGEFVSEAQKNADFMKVINSADLVIPDTTNVVWAARLIGYKLPEVTPGSDLTERLCQLAAKENKTVYLLGSRGEVPRLAAVELARRYPGLQVAGYSSADPDNAMVLEELKNKKPDIIFVAYGAPKQEIWIKTHKDGIGAKILVGVGGTFDMLAGVLPRAPKWMRSLHLEWLWRLILQPSRFGRIFNSLIFPIRVFFSQSS